MLIAAPRLRGAGRLTNTWLSPDGEILAVASDFPLLTAPPARASYKGQRLRHRLALYRREEAAPLAAFDDLAHPVTAVAFHPSKPSLAIGAGSYDGGWMFEGDLALWNWREGTVWRPFVQLPEVVTVRFEDGGERLALLVRPWDESLEDVGEDVDPFRCAYPLTVRLDAQGPIAGPKLNPSLVVQGAAGSLTTADLASASRASGEEVAVWRTVAALDLTGAVLDLAMLSDGRIASVYEDGSFRVHAPGGRELFRWNADDEHRPVAILQTTPPTIHLASRPGPRFDGRSRLATLADDRLAIRAELSGSWLFSASADGRVLGRLDRSFGATGDDLVIDAPSSRMRRIDLGHYDVFNHHLRIDNAPDLYFLQSTPPDGHERKWLCRLCVNDAIERLWPVLPDDGTPSSHAMDCCGCWVEDASGPAVVLAGMYHHPDPSAPRSGFLYRRAPEGKAAVWRQATTAGCSTIVFLQEAGLIAAAFLDGTLRLIDARLGVTRLDAPVTGVGQPTVIFALAADDARLVAGTFDGVVATLDVERLLTDQPSTIGLDHE